MVSFPRPLTAVFATAALLLPALGGGTSLAHADPTAEGHTGALAPSNAASTSTAAGTLLESRSTPHPLNLAAPALRAAGMDPGALSLGEASRIRYTTTMEDGTAAEATGVVMEGSSADAPTLVMAPGTRGQGDNCSPSGSWLQLGSVDTHSVNINYELPIMYLALAQGWRVVMTDYIGLGTPDLHRYVNATEQAHAVLDAARAITQQGQKVALYGYSQGGGAVGAAAEQAATYAPELELSGAFVGAPPADLRVVVESVDESFLAGALGYAMNAAATEPAVAEALDRHLNEEGKQLLADSAHACTVDTVARWAFRSTRDYTVDGSSAAELIDREPALAEYIDRQKLGRTAPSFPTLVGSNRHDHLIPWEQARQLAEDWCAGGATVDFLTFGGNTGMATHATTVFSAVLPAFEWLRERFDGTPAASTCAAGSTGGAADTE